MIKKDSYVNNLKINGKVVQRTFKGKEFSKSEIKNLVGEFQNKYKNKNLTLMLGVNTPFGFRNSKSFDIHDEPSMVDDYDWETTNQFVIYGWKTNIAEGGTGEKNDCLFRCIQKLLTTYRLPKGLKTDLDMKNAISIHPHEKVPLSKLPIIEKLYKINIHVTGDHSYTSPNKYKHQTLNLSLINEHYEIQKDNLKSKSLLKNLPNKQQSLIFTIFQEDTVKCFDGNQVFYLSYNDYNLKRNDFYGDFAYLEDFPLKKSLHSDFKQDYHYFLEECEKLKELTHDKIDLSKSGYKISNEAIKCAHYSLISFHEPEAITPSEQEWFYRCFKVV